MSLKLEREVYLRRQRFKESFDRIKKFKRIKEVANAIMDKIKESYVNGKCGYFVEICYFGDSNNETEFFKKNIKKQLLENGINGELAIYETANSKIRVDIEFQS